jgi:UDP-glucose 4-epimerase
MKQVLLTGAAGFIGSHLADRLLALGCLVTGIDNFTRGSRDNLVPALTSPNFRLIECDLSDIDTFRAAMEAESRHFDEVWHMAANSDIPAGVADPVVDYRDTFLTTFNVLRLMRELQIPRIAFASTSAIYGNLPQALTEDIGPLFPISNYGAMKLASEASVSAAAESFLERAWIFRFPNVIGPRATHGIIYDLLQKIRGGPDALEVLGDGSQQKPYLHVSELIDAMLLVHDRTTGKLEYFNIGPDDEGVQVRFIAETVIRAAAPDLPIRYTGGSRGWVGDVPRFRYSVDKIAKLGWQPSMKSAETVERAVAEICEEFFERADGYHRGR